jgi:hypothetical protein
MSNELISTALGGFLAVGGGLVSTWFHARVARDAESRQLAMALKGEISAIVEIATARDYAKALEAAIRYIEEKNEPFIIGVSVRREYDVVYRQNASRIGLLKGDLPTRVAVVYTKVSAILEDFVLLYEARHDPARQQDFDVGYCLEIYRELHALIVSTLDQARDVICRIDRAYPSK